jgi:hypothetical protein
MRAVVAPDERNDVLTCRESLAQRSVRYTRLQRVAAFRVGYVRVRGHKESSGASMLRSFPREFDCVAC